MFSANKKSSISVNFAESKTAKNLIIALLNIALGLVLPVFICKIPNIGNKLLPIHIPVFLCALTAGWQYGLAVGFILPLLRSLMFGMPRMYPQAIAMAFEMAAYGLSLGLIYGKAKKQNIAVLYLSLISSMIIGRIIWGIAEIILLGIDGNSFTMNAFISGAFLNAIPGIILQLTAIPALMLIFDRTGVLEFRDK